MALGVADNQRVWDSDGRELPVLSLATNRVADFCSCDVFESELADSANVPPRQATREVEDEFAVVG